MKNDLQFIGTIVTPYQTLAECPPNISEDGPMCILKIDEVFQEGLVGLSAGEKILVLYWLYSENRSASISPDYTGEGMYGTFALRTPYRPNPIGVALVTIESIEGGSVYVKGLDCLDGTRLLDIKPAIREEVKL